MSFLEKLQRQPKYIRKIILWLVIIIIGLALVVWWLHSSYWRIKEFPKEEFIKKLNFPNPGEKIKELQEIEMPKIDEEKLEELKEKIEQLEEEEKAKEKGE